MNVAVVVDVHVHVDVDVIGFFFGCGSAALSLGGEKSLVCGERNQIRSVLTADSFASLGKVA